MTTIDELAIVAAGASAAAAGVNIATITAQPADGLPHNGYVMWGTATGVYTGMTPPVFTKPTFDPATTNTYNVATWEIDNLQNATDTNYFAKVFWDNGTQSTEVPFTIKGLNASPSDTVYFEPRNLTRLARISGIATKASAQGWLNPQEYQQFKLLVLSTSWFNHIGWFDGR
jgi:hypothetical protein